MGANVADFTVIRDTVFAVDQNGLDSETFAFEFREGFLQDLDAIISFMIHSSNNLRLRVAISNTPVVETDVADGNLARAFHEVFAMRSLTVGGLFSIINQATFTAIRGRGTFSDVVVWYRRDSE